ncbi:putative exosome component 10 [Apostichopus japonicus]|uniref:Exosome complex component 10 homolog n=1 Tax=Stichopus japonicus TaxID=307972 RepID=A0A2G8JBQ3_STIJA|nr:putative exosome component 10 [Apostichopus japonicus]
MEDESHSEESLIEGYESIDSFAQNAFATIVAALKAGNGLPRHGDNFDFYSSFDGFRRFCHENGEKTLQIIRQVIGNRLMTNALAKSSLNLEIEDKLEALIDANDNIIEKVGILLDEASGIKKTESPLLINTNQKVANVSIASWNRKNDDSANPKQSFHMMYAKNTIRPQLKFEVKVDNSNVPFRPIIKHKPNALKPLNIDQGQKFQSVQDFITQQRMEFEIENFEPGDSHLEVEEGYQYLPVLTTPLTFITTPDQLKELSDLLNTQTSFGVDLEHHSYRSFQGFTCLMQISTRDHDYLIDTLELRSHLFVLNESFTDPKIVKIFHGAMMDIEWLQKDFGIYVVNLFDTGEASKLLGLARNSLAFLMKHYCNVESDKKYQLADWRIRPLPEAMKRYAREDTHYLLYICNKMKEELIKLGNKQKNLLKAVFERSKAIALRKYNKPLFTNVSYLILYKKNRKSFNAKQIHAFRLLYAWRDSIAREEDESTGYILPNHMLFQIAEHLPQVSVVINRLKGVRYMLTSHILFEMAEHLPRSVLSLIDLKE